MAMSKMYEANIKKEKVMLKISYHNIYLMYIKQINKEIKEKCT